MNVVPLTVETGRELGSSPSRRMRAEGRIPATVYGMGQDTVSVTVERSELRRALTTPAGVNALIQLAVDGTDQYTLVKEIQRHPVRRDPIHIDFQRIDPETPMSLSVPIVLIGDAKQVTSNGGMIEHSAQQLQVSVRPDAIPNEIVVDITNLQIDDVVTVGDLPLPDGVTTDTDPGAPVVVASLTRAAMIAARVAAGGTELDAEGEPVVAAAADDAPADA